MLSKLKIEKDRFGFPTFSLKLSECYLFIENISYFIYSRLDVITLFSSFKIKKGVFSILKEAFTYAILRSGMR